MIGRSLKSIMGYSDNIAWDDVYIYIYQGVYLDDFFLNMGKSPHMYGHVHR